MNQRLPFYDFDFAFVDTETTGLAFSHEMIEIAVLRASNYNFAVLEEWEAKIKPKNIAIASPEALIVAHYSEAAWAGARPLEEVMPEFVEKTKNTILVGHNLPFDWTHIHRALAACNLEPPFWYKGLDTVSLAWYLLRGEKGIQSFSLQELSKYFGITQDNPHSALDDARTTHRVFVKLVGLEKGVMKSKQ